MTRRTVLWIATIAAALLLPCIALAATPINETTFPDANFRAIALANYSDGSGNVDESVTVIDVSYSNIRDLTGIAYYTALTDLYCITNQLTALDVSNNTSLMMLHCFNNSLTTLDVSKNTALESLYCYFNKLTSLDLSNNTLLIDSILSNQYVGPLVYTQFGDTYQVNLTELPRSDLIDMTRVAIVDGGILNPATGIVTYASPPSTVRYDYDTHSAGSGTNLMFVIVSVIPPASPQTGDGSRPVLWAALGLLAAAGLGLLVLHKFRKACKRS